MDKPPPRSSSKKLTTPTTAQEWESLIDDFHSSSSSSATVKWTPLIPSIIDNSLSSLLKPSFPLSLKLHLLSFLDQFSLLLFSTTPAASSSLSSLLRTLTSIIQSPLDTCPSSLKEFSLVSATSVLMSATTHDCGDDVRVRVSVWRREIEELVGVLLAIINRPNHGGDRQIRLVACECLRELEMEFPCLLSEIAGHLWSLCQNERTHACQSYILLFMEVVCGMISGCGVIGSVFSTVLPLVPFNVPASMVASDVEEEEEGGGVGMSEVSLRELRRVVAFLLEWPQVLTPCGMVEFVLGVVPLAVGLELQSSLLKVQFGGLMYNDNPLLWHVVLMLAKAFPDMYDGNEGDVCKRLVLISKEEQQPLVFRLLALHWLLGYVGLVSEKGVGKRELIGGNVKVSFYPKVYDALALKALKLELLAFSEDDCGGGGDSVGKCLEDALVCVAAFKWLPPWSTETVVAFRTLHKFLIGASSHLDTDISVIEGIMESAIFRSIQTLLVTLLLDHRKLVPVVVVLINRLLSCEKHCWLGQKLLQTFDECVLPKIVISYRLSSYFLLFERIGKNDSVPPQRLLELLTKFTMFLVEKQGPDSGLKSWSQGSKVLAICRTLILHHQSSRLFMGLSRLLAFTSLYFPDLEIRDNARMYLRMLICIPGKKLRHILSLGDQLVGISPSPHASSLFSGQSPRLAQDLKKSKNISSYIHLERVIPLLVKQSWSLALPALGYEVENDGFIDGVKDDKPLLDEKDSSGNNTIEPNHDTKRIDQPQEPLRVMDSKISEIVDILRKHFSGIPDFRHMSALKIRILCTLSFKSEPYNHVWGPDSSQIGADELEALPGMYGIVLKFSSSAPYGCMPSYHIPILLGESSSADRARSEATKDIVPVGTAPSEKSISGLPVTIELEPRDPVPGLVDVTLDANTENGQVIHGKLQGVSVGIEDMFLKAAVPAEIPEVETPVYYSRLFDALWEVCGSSSNSGRETFSLKGGKGFAAIYGTQSVKLLEVPSTFTVRVVECYLASFVVSVVGAPLVDIVKDGGYIKDVRWMDAFPAADESSAATNFDGGPLYLTYIDNNDAIAGKSNIGKANMGCFLVLIFLPPRYHLLFRMEISDESTLVRIRTDHWPCLAYVDDYLEALFSS